MLEKTVEQYLKDKVESIGGLCPKFISPGYNGVPDRIILYNGYTVFVETKAPGGKPRPLQKKIQAQMKKAGAEIHNIDTRKKVDELINDLKNRKEQNKS